MNIFFSIPLIFFWSVVLSFVPAVIYLIINPLESIKAEELSSRNIFIIKQESALNKEKRKRNKGVCIIYSICLAITTCFALFNWARSGQAAIIPLDILSVTSGVFFCFAALTYLPVMLCLAYFFL